jgi:hypothetical protein
VVGLINSSFSTNFSEIGCAGEVHLAQHEDYDKFSIQVRLACGGHIGVNKNTYIVQKLCVGGETNICKHY